MLGMMIKANDATVAGVDQNSTRTVFVEVLQGDGIKIQAIYSTRTSDSGRCVADEEHVAVEMFGGEGLRHKAPETPVYINRIFIPRDRLGCKNYLVITLLKRDKGLALERTGCNV
jgi:hypothetical protein